MPNFWAECHEPCNEYRIDPKAEVGKRISEVMVHSAGRWQSIDGSETYGVAANNYIRSGEDGYDILATKAADIEDFGPDLADVVAEYLATQLSAFLPKLDGRMTAK